MIHPDICEHQRFQTSQHNPTSCQLTRRHESLGYSLYLPTLQGTWFAREQYNKSAGTVTIFIFWALSKDIQRPYAGPYTMCLEYWAWHRKTIHNVLRTGLDSPEFKWALFSNYHNNLVHRCFLFRKNGWIAQCSPFNFADAVPSNPFPTQRSPSSESLIQKPTDFDAAKVFNTLTVHWLIVSHLLLALSFCETGKVGGYQSAAQCSLLCTLLASLLVLLGRPHCPQQLLWWRELCGETQWPLLLVASNDNILGTPSTEFGSLDDIVSSKILPVKCLKFYSEFWIGCISTLATGSWKSPPQCHWDTPRNKVWNGAHLFCRDVTQILYLQREETYTSLFTGILHIHHIPSGAHILLAGNPPVINHGPVKNEQFWRISHRHACLPKSASLNMYRNIYIYAYLDVCMSVCTHACMDSCTYRRKFRSLTGLNSMTPHVAKNENVGSTTLQHYNTSQQYITKGLKRDGDVKFFEQWRQ